MFRDVIHTLKDQFTPVSLDLPQAFELRQTKDLEEVEHVQLQN